MHHLSTTDSTLPTQHLQLSDDAPLEDFYCGCGLLFEDQDMFKSHSLQKHRGRYILDSSHYINKINQKVMVCEHWDPSVFKITPYTLVKAMKQPKITQHFKQETRHVRDRLHRIMPNKVLNTLKLPIEQKIQLNENGRKKKQQILKGRSCLNQKLQNSCLSSKNAVFNNDSSLTKVQNEEIKQEILSISWSQISPIDKGQIDIISKTKSLEMKIEEITSQKVVQGSNHLVLNSDQKQNKPSEIVKIIICNSLFIQMPTYMVKAFQFLRQLVIRSVRGAYVTYKCGCGLIIKQANKVKNGAYKHIVKEHRYIVPDNSSHIFLIRKGAQDVRDVYRLLSVDSNDNTLGWYCPCTLGVDMTQKQLIKHVIQVHKGMSPAYKFPAFQTRQKIQKKI